MQEVLYCAKRAGVTHILKAGGAQVVIIYVVISCVFEWDHGFHCSLC